MHPFSSGRKLSALEASFEAQKIAFGPIVFQCVVSLMRSGLLKAIADAGEQGINLSEAAAASGLTPYSCSVLLETGMAAGVCSRSDEGEPRFVLGDIGYCFLRDEMTRVNVNFVQDVCYRAVSYLDESLRTGMPAGLRELGDWETVYQGLAQLPEPARKSWLEFDHFYSDAAFDRALPMVFDRPVASLLDIGGNTGKWASQCLRFDADVRVTIADLAGQIAMAEQNLSEQGLCERVRFAPRDFIDAACPELPEGQDVVWMSQFLVCFSEEQIIRILGLARRALAPGGRIIILDTFWDLQPYAIAAYCVINTSPYFTAVANGNSKMYGYAELQGMAKKAEMELSILAPLLGSAHSLLTCRPL